MQLKEDKEGQHRMKDLEIMETIEMIRMKTIIEEREEMDSTSLQKCKAQKETVAMTMMIGTRDHQMTIIEIGNNLILTKNTRG